MYSLSIKETRKGKELFSGSKMSIATQHIMTTIMPWCVIIKILNGFQHLLLNAMTI